jgi:hypothetical protein
MVRLADLNQKRIAVSVRLGGKLVLLKGVGSFETDPQLGNLLRIRLHYEPGVDIVVREEAWSGDIIPLENIDSDYIMPLSQSALATQ